MPTLQRIEFEDSESFILNKIDSFYLKGKINTGLTNQDLKLKILDVQGDDIQEFKDFYHTWLGRPTTINISHTDTSFRGMLTSFEISYKRSLPDGSDLANIFFTFFAFESL